MQKGNISVQTENIFPIIKQYLYSDQEIFLRELVSNAVDATNKLKTLVSKGVYKGKIGDETIEILLDEKKKTLTIRDKGVGMTAEEMEKYLNQVAFSSAAEFLEKYKDDSGIIGHFGLGFYSAFMVAKKVEVHSLSYQEGAEPAIWTCEGTPEYTLEKGDREQRGTDVVLYINEDSDEYLQKSRIEGLLKKYCRFLPIPIKFGKKKETIWEGEGEDKKSKEVEVENIINNTDPIWKKQPTDLKDEDYVGFYRELYPYSEEPLFWIHLNIDYPFNLTGVLYFPKIKNNYEVQRNKIQLYSNQVYVTDEVKDIVPEFLAMLHGVIDSPDIPLNVSRSYLQSDRNVKKITNYISKKVAEKLDELYQNEPDAFKEKWSDIGFFVKYGMISDDKFYDRALKFALVKNIDDEYYTVEEYRDKVKEHQTDKNDRVVCLYTNDPKEHDSFIRSAKAREYDVLEMDNVIDNHFMQHLEQKLENTTFVRVDADTIDHLIEKDEERESVLTEKDQEKVKKIFEKQLEDMPQSNLDTKALSPDDLPVIVTKPEFMRRMQEMQALQGGPASPMGDFYNVVVNTNHPLIAEKLTRMRGDDRKGQFARYLFDLALLNQNMLKGSELTKFIERSLEYAK